MSDTNNSLRIKWDNYFVTHIYLYIILIDLIKEYGLHRVIFAHINAV
jgi:hypothetical protein